MDDLLKDLMETIDKLEASELVPNLDSESFQIETRDQANYFLRKYNENIAEQKEVENIAQSQIKAQTERITTWKEKRLDTLKHSEAFLSSLLKDFAIRDLQGTKLKSIKLPQGQIGFSKQQPEFSYDEDKIMAYLKANGLEEKYVVKKVTESISKQEIKKAGQIKGNTLMIGDSVIDGIVVTEREDRFVIK